MSDRTPQLHDRGRLFDHFGVEMTTCGNVVMVLIAIGEARRIDYRSFRLLERPG